MTTSKKRSAGRFEREKLIDAFWPGERQRLWRELPRGAAQKDDLNDAFAALWTGLRIRRSGAIALPASELVDSVGLRMVIWA